MSAVARPAEANGSLRVASRLARLPALWLAALAFVLYLPPAISVLQLDPDAIEHVDLARRFVAGEGYVLGIKSYHLGGNEVIHNGLDERSPLYPLLVAALFLLGFGPLALQVLNAFLAAGCVALIYGIGTSISGRRTGLLAGLLAAASPPVLVFLLPPMTEALALSLTLLAAWLLIRDLERPAVGVYLLAGLALGLAYLTRPVALAAMAALVSGLILASRSRRSLIRPLAALLGGVVLLALPITVFSLLTRGSPFYSRQTYLYSVYEPADVHRNTTFTRSITTPLEFVVANREFVLSAMLEHIHDYANLLFLDSKWLLLLLPAWPFVIFALVRGRYPRAAWPVLCLAVVNFMAYGLTWSAWTRRYQLLTLLLLLPFAVDGLGRLGLARFVLPLRPHLTALHLAVFAVTLIWFQAFVQEYRGTFRYGDEPVGVRSYHGVRWTGSSAWTEDKDISQMLDWINASTQRSDVLAHAQPGIFTFFTQRPSTRLPRRLEPETLRGFLVNYRVSYVLLNNYDGYRRRYQDDLLAMEAQGVRSTAVEDYRVFDTRALWR